MEVTRSFRNKSTVPAGIASLLRKEYSFGRFIDGSNTDGVSVDDWHKSQPGRIDSDRERITIKNENDGTRTHVYEDHSSRTWDSNHNETQ